MAFAKSSNAVESLRSILATPRVYQADARESVDVWAVAVAMQVMMDRKRRVRCFFTGLVCVKIGKKW